MAYLFGDEQRDALEELVAVEGGDGEVEEQPVEHWSRDEFELFDEQNGQADQNVRQDSSDTRLAYTDDPDTRQLDWEHFVPLYRHRAEVTEMTERLISGVVGRNFTKIIPSGQVSFRIFNQLPRFCKKAANSKKVTVLYSASLRRRLRCATASRKSALI